MKFRLSNAVLIYALCVCSVNYATAMPRTVEKHDEVVPVPTQTLGVVQLEKSGPVEHFPSVTIPGRVACQHEDATEDAVCQELCRPKGYTQGLCVHYTCSCI